jgi:hypothetical protein
MMANNKGVLIGVGLHMIERAFTTLKTSPERVSTPPKQPPAKKQKLKPATYGESSGEDDGDDDDNTVVAALSQIPAHSSRSAARGTGYSGATSEDVRESHGPVVYLLIRSSARVSSLRRKCNKLQTQRSSNS